MQDLPKNGCATALDRGFSRGACIDFRCVSVGPESEKSPARGDKSKVPFANYENETA